MEHHRIIELVGMIARHLARQLAPIAEAEKLSITEVLVLWKMNRKRVCRVTEIAEEIGVSPSTFTGVLDRLVTAEWLTREPDPEDRRAILVKVTPAVGPLLKRLLHKSDEHLEGLFHTIPAERLLRLAGDLEALSDCLQTGEEKR